MGNTLHLSQTAQAWMSEMYRAASSGDEIGLNSLRERVAAYYKERSHILAMREEGEHVNLVGLLHAGHVRNGELA